MATQTSTRRGGIRVLVSKACATAGLAALYSALLSGCAHAPFDDSPPGVPGHFETVTTTAAPKISHWWTRFGSRELDNFMAEANAGNYDIAVAYARLKQSEATADVTEAALYPTLNFSSDSQRSQGSGTSVPHQVVHPNARNSYNALFNVSYVADVWGQNRNLLEAALHNQDASAYQVEVTRLTARAAVVNDFLIYAADYERVQISKENLTNAKRILAVIKDRAATGTASKLDVSQQDNLVATQEAAIPVLRALAETSRTALALVMGRAPQGFHPVTKSTRGLKLPAVSPGLPSSLLVRRPDIRQAEEQMAADEANVEAARKAFLPTFTLNGDVGRQSALISAFYLPQSVVWSIAASAAQPIFDGGKLRAQLRLSEAQREELLNTYRKSVIQALVDVENALINIRENDLRERALRRAVTSAKEAFDLSEQRLHEGTIDITTLLNVQNTLFTAQDSLVQARLARLQALVALFQALGGDWDNR